MKKVTLFSFGYYGWGNHTPQLVQAVDAVETSRGFEPPTFVDIRIRRIVRAKGFRGNAFERLLGQNRHRWMKSLGNKFIETRAGPQVQIANPGAADDLLDLAIESARHAQRVVFFCGCEWPRCGGKIACHRTTVASLLLKAARKHGIRIEVVEWPGGEPTTVDLRVSPEVFAAARHGKMKVALGEQLPSPTLLGLPWCSVVTLRSGTDQLKTICGRAKHLRHEWCLPVQWLYFDPEKDLAAIERKAAHERAAFGLNRIEVDGNTAVRRETSHHTERLHKAPKPRAEYTAECVFTVLHSKKLAKIYRSGGAETFKENKKWVSAQKLLQDARSAARVVPVIFAAGEDIWELTHFAELDDVKIAQDKEGNWSTTVSIVNLTKIRPPRPNKTRLKVCSTEQRLPPTHIRPYVLVETPTFLTKKGKKG
ncbi:MAG: hypothetical protein ACREHD_11910 [Pirellulales bacterium]